MPTLKQTDIRARVDAFVDDLSSLVRDAALEAVQAALGGTVARAGAPAGLRRKKAASRKKAGRKGGTRVGTGKVLAAIKAAGEPVRSETLAGALGTDSPSLKPALDELVASKQVKRAGAARGTTYEAGSGGAGAPKKKAAKKAKRKRSKKATRRKTSTK